MNRKETWPAQLGVADEKKKHQPNHYKVMSGLSRTVVPGLLQTVLRQKWKS